MSNSEISPTIAVEIIDATAIIRFDRPTKRNSLSQDTLDRLEHSLGQLSSRNDLNALIFTGSESVFASGADIMELSKLTPKTALDFAKRGQAVLQKIADTQMLTIAAINGYCMGGGLDLALACDVRIASRNAVFVHPGARLGIITGWGGTQRLPRLIGRARALELFVTAVGVEAQQALDIGLVSEICDPVLDRALQLARTTRATA